MGGAGRKSSAFSVLRHVECQAQQACVSGDWAAHPLYAGSAAEFLSGLQVESGRQRLSNENQTKKQRRLKPSPSPQHARFLGGASVRLCLSVCCPSTAPLQPGRHLGRCGQACGRRALFFLPRPPFSSAPPPSRPSSCIAPSWPSRRPPCQKTLIRPSLCSGSGRWANSGTSRMPSG